jgi:hypothetical protein
MEADASGLPRGGRDAAAAVPGIRALMQSRLPFRRSLAHFDAQRSGIVTFAVGDEHAAERPSWNCRQCGDPWPCGPARGALLAEMDCVSLAIFMWLSLEEAVHDMPSWSPPDLYARFIEWTH